MNSTAEESLDSILGGALRLIQPRRGYRFSLDAVLLGRFARARARDRVLELGAGCGVVSLMIARLYRPREIVAIELQPAMAALARRNADLNSIRNVRVICADLRRTPGAASGLGGFDLVLANPPYRAARSGRESPDAQRAVARGGAGARLEDFVAAAARDVRHGGRVAFVFTAARCAELLALMRAYRIEPKRLRFVHPRVEVAANIVLVDARKGGGVECKVEPPLILYSHKGVLGDEARILLG